MAILDAPSVGVEESTPVMGVLEIRGGVDVFH